MVMSRMLFFNIYTLLKKQQETYNQQIQLFVFCFQIKLLLISEA